MLTEEQRAKSRAESDRLWKQAGREVLIETLAREIPLLLWRIAIAATIFRVWWPRH